ncbi:MAG TPA: NigD-like C-terminal domain-containing protein [Draconibacterium sp.]|nr:NigD-like C-terminal domain-containing protein [Draconibacterium sp.]
MMKKLAFGLLAVMSIAIISCLNDDGYSLNDQWVGFGMIQENAGVRLIKMDDGVILRPVAWENGLNYGDDFDNGSRLLINFTVLDEIKNNDGTVNQYQVKINDASEVLLKGIFRLTEENADSIGNDPIIVQEHWMTDSLINFKLKYWGYNKTHFLNLVQETEEPVLEEPIKLELRHNANEDEEALSYTAFVSFSLNKLRIAGKDSITVEISSTGYEGVTHTFQEVFNYKDLPYDDPLEQE